MIRDKKDLDGFVARMAAGRKAAASKRVSSTAPPSPPPMKSKSIAIPDKAKAAGDAPLKASMPEPKKSGGKKPGSQGKHVTIHIHNH